MPHHTMMLAIAISLNSYEELIKNICKKITNIHIVGLFELKVESDHWSCKA